MIYVDTTALTKLLIAEPETPELQAWLSTHLSQGEFAATSALSQIELMRVVARYGDSAQTERARYLLDGIDILPITESLLTAAATISPPTLRTLDTLHLAAATQIQQELTAFVTYDHHLVDGCRKLGFPAVSPGQTH